MSIVEQLQNEILNLMPKTANNAAQVDRLRDQIAKEIEKELYR